MQGEVHLKAQLGVAAVERSREHQIIFLTDDEEIATWARVEALAGEMAVVEPVATNTNRRAGVAA